MGREIAISLTDEQQTQLEALASACAQTPEQVLQRAVSNYLEADVDYLAAVAEGDADFEAGRSRDFEDVARDLKERLESRIRDRHG